MKSYRSIAILLLLSLLCIAAGEPTSSERSKEKGWLAFGDMRGALEPCGCDPATDLGGLRRIGRIVERERLLMPNLWLFSLGNNFAETKPRKDAKTPFLAEGIARLKTDAALFGESEWEIREEICQWHSEKKNRIPFVLSQRSKSLRKKFACLGVQSQIRKPDLIVLGFNSNLQKKLQLEKFSARLLQRWRKQVKGRRNKSKHSVLLFAGTKKELGSIVKADIFDEIISSNAKPAGTPLDNKEHDDSKQLVRFSEKDTLILSVPLGGQGVLRGGQLLQQRALSLTELFASSTNTEKESMTMQTPVTWLDSSFETDHPFVDLFKRYNDDASERFAALEKKRAPHLKNSQFVGAEKCVDCHKSAYAVWKNSKHAHAYGTLKGKDKTRDPECVGCHVVGYKYKGGFASLKLSPQLANVQCENCHGSRKEHVLNPLKGADKKFPQNFSSCNQCHVPEHSPKFDRKEYWSRIKHSK